MLQLYMHVDESSKQVTAFRILADVMNTTKQSTLCYLYSEYEVRYGSPVLYFTFDLYMYYDYTSFSFQQPWMTSVRNHLFAIHPV